MATTQTQVRRWDSVKSTKRAKSAVKCHKDSAAARFFYLPWKKNIERTGAQIPGPVRDKYKSAFNMFHNQPKSSKKSECCKIKDVSKSY